MDLQKREFPWEPDEEYQNYTKEQDEKRKADAKIDRVKILEDMLDDAHRQLTYLTRYLDMTHREMDMADELEKSWRREQKLANTAEFWQDVASMKFDEELVEKLDDLEQGMEYLQNQLDEVRKNKIEYHVHKMYLKDKPHDAPTKIWVIDYECPEYITLREIEHEPQWVTYDEFKSRERISILEAEVKYYEDLCREYGLID